MRIRRCQSSPSSWLSLSESEPSSKVSARFLSASEVIGSSESRRRDVGEEARDRKDGGGEVGTKCGFLRVGEVDELSS